MVEYVFGSDGYPMTHEWTLYVFDSAPMLLVTIIFFFRFPSNLPWKLGDDDGIQLESGATCDTDSERRS
jgi:hypothetical protein